MADVSDYFDFVLAIVEGEDKPRLFRSPAFSDLLKGDSCVVEDGEKKRALVLSHVTLSTSPHDRNIVDFIMCATGSPLDVPKVVSKVIYQPFIYGEDGNAETGDGAET